MSEAKTEQLNLRMSSTGKALLRAAAAKEHRTISNMVEHLVLDYCEKHNILDANTEKLIGTNNENR